MKRISCLILLFLLGCSKCDYKTGTIHDMTFYPSCVYTLKQNGCELQGTWQPTLQSNIVQIYVASTTCNENEVGHTYYYDLL